MNGLDLDAIRARAIAAGGADARWRVCSYTSYYGYIESLSGELVLHDNQTPTKEQVFHIAGMDPATTLALIDEIDRLKDEIADLGDRLTRAPPE